MMDQNLTDYGEIFKKSRSIAVVGMSPKAARPSHMVAKYLLGAGFTIFPVNPGQESILGITCYPDLLSIPEPIDIVDIFRKPNAIPGMVNDAIKIGAKVIWMQLGITHEAAAAKAHAAGLAVIMDRCIKVDHQNLLCGE